MREDTARKLMTYLLKPLSWVYGGITSLRNWMFDHDILTQEEFDVPVVSVGNITVGGTGKTPHVEYILSMLSMDYNIAVLSRGYKRKTKGFILANAHSTPDSIGDEPLQIYRKYGMKVKVAVCESRRKGIKELLRQFPDLQLILLDDGFQHRYVKPKISILLMDFARPIYEDNLLPLGRLRESAHQVGRADIVVVTKCPEELPPLEYRLITKKLDLMAFQRLYFSRFSYGQLTPVFQDDEPYNVSLSGLTERDGVFLVTGIANPRTFVRHFKNYPFKVKVAHFSDHRDFTRDDIQLIKDRFRTLTGERKIIVTTEKDAVRLMYNPYFPSELKKLIYYLPVTVKMEPVIDDGDFIGDLRKDIEAVEI
ncbi:MAG: tetraacyldisaccharide 4'-kinase [Muribaculaceae bacterium]|nr:tetraacyldisaccharide 4'-kinase [Muribaculaceae bacterium]